MNDELVWTEKYRPKKVEDCILPDRIKSNFLEFVKSGNFPNLLLTGTAGTGKTSIAKALCNELGYEYIIINASDERNIDVVRTRIRNFASVQSFSGAKKAIILDEADGLSAITQPALRAAMEEFHFVKFILTCNYKNKLIDPIHSRTSAIEFNIQKEEKLKMTATFLKRCFEILEAEGIEYDKMVVATVVKKYYPDNRKILNDLQRYSVGGKIDTGMLSSAVQGADVKQLVSYIKEKNFRDCRQWVANNSDTDTSIIFRGIYDEMYNEVKPESVPALVMILAQYQYWATMVADQEINTMALISEMMNGLEFK